MEGIPEDNFLEYNEDDIVAIRKLYNLDKPGAMDEAINLLDAWAKKQNHFVRKDFPRKYLERLIIQLNGSVERAKTQLEAICTLRTLLPDFFTKYDAKNDFKELKGYVYTTLLPKLTKSHYRIYMSRYMDDKQFSPQIFSQVYFINLLICEYIKAHDYNDGIVIIVDFRNVNIIDFAIQLSITEMKQTSTIALEGYKSKVKSFIYISTSKAVENLLKIFKQMLSEKLRNRMHVVKNVEELHEHVSKELLPADYGGNEKSLEALNDEFLDVLSSKENVRYFKEMSKCRVDENLRDSSKSNEEFVGIAGTFRTLNVD